MSIEDRRVEKKLTLLDYIKVIDKKYDAIRINIANNNSNLTLKKLNTQAEAKIFEGEFSKLSKNIQDEIHKSLHRKNMLEESQFDADNSTEYFNKLKYGKPTDAEWEAKKIQKIIFKNMSELAKNQRDCDANDYNACYKLAIMYRVGKVVKENKTKTKKLFTIACENNHYESCDSLGNMYEYGDGVKKDRNKAKKIYTKLCVENFYEGCYHLGQLHAYKNGELKYSKKAIKPFRKACTAKIAYACAELSSIYRFGIEVNKDIEKALEFSKKACDYSNDTHSLVCFDYEDFLKKRK